MNPAEILIYACLGIIGIGALLILGFGVLNLTRGKSSPVTLAIIAVPLIVFALWYVMAPADFLATLVKADGSYSVGAGGYAVMMTALTMLGLGAVGLLATTARGFFK
ncbi:MAG: hypothetical protein AAGF99_14845 [Bacteroidota bacterium]